MRIEIMALGDALPVGQISDSNTGWMARELRRQGYEIVAVTSVGCRQEAIFRALDKGIERADILLLTAGVDPIRDDSARELLSQYFQITRSMDEEVLRHLESIFLRRNPPQQPLMCSRPMLPAGSRVIRNSHSAATIVWLNSGEQVLGERLCRERLTLSTAESCTGGYIAHRITAIPGASDYFVGAIVSYANSIKEALLEVDHQIIEKHGAVSRQVAERMATHGARMLESDCCIAVTGIMGPDGASWMIINLSTQNRNREPVPGVSVSLCHSGCFQAERP